MTSLSLPDSRHRFLQMLWLSAALHAAVIGLTRLPPQSLAQPPQELQVQLAEPLAAVALPAPVVETLPARPPAAQPEAAPVPSKVPPAQAVPQPALLPAAAPVPSNLSAISTQVATAQTAPVQSAATSHDAPGPQLNIPLAVDLRYYATKELDAVPVPVRKPDPVYPAQAEDQNVSGHVLLRLHLEADGSISQSEVIAVSPGGVFGELFKKSALDSIKATKFRPAKRNGLPVRALVEFRVVFEHDGS